MVDVGNQKVFTIKNKMAAIHWIESWEVNLQTAKNFSLSKLNAWYQEAYHFCPTKECEWK